MPVPKVSLKKNASTLNNIPTEIIQPENREISFYIQSSSDYSKSLSLSLDKDIPVSVISESIKRNNILMLFLSFINKVRASKQFFWENENETVIYK